MSLAVLKWTPLSLLALYVVALAAVGVFQRRLQYFPDARHVAPAEAGLAGVEELRLSTEDGETLVAWHAPAGDGRPLILYFHGNGGALVDRAARFRAFMGEGFGFLAIAYRGYGGSTGAPSEAGLMLDAEVAYAEARGRGYGAERVVILGESLGTGVATQLAARRPAAALVLDSPFSSALDVAQWRFPLFPVRWLMADPFRSDLAIPAARLPLLIVHGDADGIVPFASGERLYALAAEPKSFIRVAGGPHLVLGLPDVFPRVGRWIEAALAANARRHAEAGD